MNARDIARRVPRPVRARMRSLQAWPLTARLVSDPASFRNLRRLENPLTEFGGTEAIPLRLRPLGGRTVWLRPQTTDAYVLRDTFVDRDHREPPGYDLGPEPLILDLGANIGLTAADFAARHPDARVVAVELEPGNATLAARNLEPFGARCEVVNAAVWTEAGTVSYDARRGDEVGARVAAAGRTTVAAVTLDALVDGEVAFMKMDVEGTERALLQTAAAWARRVRCLQVAVHPPYTVDECLADLDALGFAGRQTWPLPWATVTAHRRQHDG